MASYVPPKFKPFTKTKVILSLEPTPYEQSTDITALVKTGFRDAMNQGPDSEIKGPDAEQALSEPVMFQKKGDRKKGDKRVAKVVDPIISAMPGLTVKKAKATVPGKKTLYSRVDVMSRDLQAAEIGKLSQALQDMAKGLLDVETVNHMKSSL